MHTPLNRCALILLCLFAPFSLSADELSSENFVVSGAAVAPTGRTSPATSTNYTMQYEGGGLYTLGAAGTTSEEDSGGASSGSRIPSESSPQDPTEYIPPADGSTPEPFSAPSYTTDGIGPDDTEGGEPGRDTSEQGGSSGVSGNAASSKNVEKSVLGTNTGRIARVFRSAVQHLQAAVPPPLVTHTAQSAGLAGGLLLTLFSIQRVPFSITNISSLFTHGWSNMFGFLFFWRSRRAWGTVYDSKTKLPLDPAYIELFTEQGEKVGEAITDLDGRYGFLVPAGMYTMKVQKAHYQFPSANVVLTGRDVIYSNLYYGGPLEVANVVVHDVPMDPLAFDWNQYEKLRTNQLRFIREYDPLIARIMGAVFYIGLFLSLAQLTLAFTSFTITMALVYMLLFAFRIMKGKPILYGMVQKGLSPLQFALVRVYRGEQEVVARVTDRFGRYVAIVVPGVYTIRIEERVGEGVYAPLKEITLNTADGIINPRIRV